MKEEHMLYKENDEERLDSPSLIMNFHNDKVTLSEVKRNYCLYLSWSHAFRTKIKRIYKREFLGVSKEISPIFDPHT